jgi:hypothetical protein
MASLLSYVVTQQPYYNYIQYVAYNVIGGVVTLTFDSPPSSTSTDYLAIAKGGTLDAQFTFGFDTIDGSLVISGNTATLTLPIVIDNNCYVNFYYQGAQLGLVLRAKENYRYTTPAIFELFPYN